MWKTTYTKNYKIKTWIPHIDIKLLSLPKVPKCFMFLCN